MAREYCHHCRAAHEPVEEMRAEMDTIDEVIALLLVIGAVGLVVVTVVGILSAAWTP